MKSKTFVMITTALISFSLAMIVTLNVLIDPLFQYHTPWFGLEPIVTNERYQVAGMAKNFDFDNCILGNSLCENFKASSFNRYFNGKTIKLSISGSVAKDWTYVLEIIKNRKSVPQNIFSNIDPFTLSFSEEKLNADLPTFLYDFNYINDLKYLLNFDILGSYTAKALLDNMSGDVTELDLAFLKSNSSREIVIENHTRSDINKEEAESDRILYTVKRNIELLIPYIEEMSNTEFHFFFSPFSILYWENVIRENKIDWWRETFNFVCETLLEYQNVNIYLWADDEMLQIMSDLDNYIDSAHYDPIVCEDLAIRMAFGKGLLNKENYFEKIDVLFSYVEGYDYNNIWGG